MLCPRETPLSPFRDLLFLLAFTHTQAIALRDAADACAASCEVIRACAIARCAQLARPGLQDAVALVGCAADGRHRAVTMRTRTEIRTTRKPRRPPPLLRRANRDSLFKPDPGTDEDDETSAGAEEDGTAAGMQRSCTGSACTRAPRCAPPETNREILSMQRELRHPCLFRLGWREQTALQRVRLRARGGFDGCDGGVGPKGPRGYRSTTRNAAALVRTARIAWWRTLHKRTEWMRTLDVTTDATASAAARSPTCSADGGAARCPSFAAGLIDRRPSADGRSRAGSALRLCLGSVAPSQEESCARNLPHAGLPLLNKQPRGSQPAGRGPPCSLPKPRRRWGNVHGSDYARDTGVKALR